MAVLKKIKASTLMETLVATVLIVVVFMIAGMILNNLFSNTVKNNTRAIDAHLNELQYLYLHDKLEVPYEARFEEWQVSVVKNQKDGMRYLEFRGKHQHFNKIIIKELNETE